MSNRQYWDVAERVSQKTGLPADLVWAQMAHETGGFSSALTAENNFGGVTQTTPNDMPQPDGSLYYRRFESPEAFGDFYANYLSLYKEDGLFEATDPLSWAQALKNGGYYGDTVENYSAGIASWLGQEIAPEFFDRPHVLPKGHASFTSKLPEEYQAKLPEQASTWTMTKDKFLDSWFDSGVIGDARLLWKSVESGDWGNNTFGSYQPTQEDVDFVTKALPNDFTAQKFVLMSASSSQNMALLVQMKQEDAERRAKVESYGYGASTFGTVAGALLDPINLVPFAGGAYRGYSLGAKTLARLGNYAPRIDKVVRIGTRAGVTYSAYGSANVVDRYMAERSSGYEQDYTAAFLIGGAFGTFAPAAFKGLQRLAGFGDKGAQKMVGALDNMETHGISQSMDKVLPNSVRPTFSVAKTFNKLDTLSAWSNKSKYLGDLAKAEKVVAMSLKDAQEIGRMLKTPIRKNAKAFYNKAEDYTVLITDNIKKGDNIDNILKHEVGVHAGMKRNLGEKTYEDIRATVEKNIKKPSSKEWQDAVRSVPEGGWEEVLGYYVEKATAKDPLWKRLSSNAATGLRKLGYKGAFTDGEIKNFVKRSLRAEADLSRGYQLNPDGSAVVNDLKYSAENLFHPNFIEEQVNLNPLRESQEGLGKFKWFGALMDNSKFFGTYYGALANSKANTARRLAANLVSNARQGKFKGDLVMPIEDMAKDVDHKLQTHITAYWDYRNKVAFSDATDYLNPVAKMQEFNRDVIECYNATYTTNRSGLASTEFNPEARQAAAIVKNFRDEIVEIGKTSSERFGTKGKNLIDADWNPIDDELWRLMDDDKFLSFVHKFPDQPKAIEFLSEYAYKASKRDLLKDRLIKDTNSKALDQWKTAGRKGKSPEAITEITDEALEKYVRQEAKDWAMGIVDQDISNMNFKESGVHDQTNLFQQRFPMDTTMIMETPFGEKFSFDVNLRDTDLDRMMLRTSRRFAGEAALNNLYKSPDDFNMARQKLISDLDRGVQHKQITQAEKQRQLKAYDEIIRQIRGVGSADDVKGTWDAMATLMSRLSYAQNGANMGLNQLGEVGGAMGYTGGRALLHLLPTSVGRYINGLRRGKAAQEAIELAEWKSFGASVESRIWSNASSYESRVIKEATTLDAKMRHLDKVGTGLNYASKVVSYVNRLPALTDAMIRGARQDMIADSMNWSVGKRTHVIGNPFSLKKLKAAGIEGDMIDAVKSDLRKFSKRDAQGKLQDFEVDRWQKENPTTYYKWKYLVDNQGRRAIQQDTIGNKNMLKDANAFTRLLFQFKDFSLKAVNGQTMRALTNREADDLLAAMFSMATNAMVYGGLTYAKSYAYFSDDEAKRQEYLDTRLTPEMLFQAALFRGVISGSAISFGRDIYEAATGAQSFRTTVDRTGSFGEDVSLRSPSQFVGDIATQLPAVRAGTNLVQGLGNLYEVFTSDERELTERDLKKLYKNLPLQNFVPMIYFMNEALESLDLPKK